MPRYNKGDKVRVENQYIGVVREFIGMGLYKIDIPHKGTYYVNAIDLRLIARNKFSGGYVGDKKSNIPKKIDYAKLYKGKDIN